MKSEGAQIKHTVSLDIGKKVAVLVNQLFSSTSRKENNFSKMWNKVYLILKPL